MILDLLNVVEQKMPNKYSPKNGGAKVIYYGRIQVGVFFSIP